LYGAALFTQDLGLRGGPRAGRRRGAQGLPRQGTRQRHRGVRGARGPSRWQS
jgi:hypothetical protein